MTHVCNSFINDRGRYTFGIVRSEFLDSSTKYGDSSSLLSTIERRPLPLFSIMEQTMKGAITIKTNLSADGNFDLT